MTEGKGSKPLRIKVGRSMDSNQRLVPLLLFQSGAIGVELGLRLGGRIGDAPRYGGKALPGFLEITGANQDFAQAIERGRQALLLLVRKLAETSQELLDGVAFKSLRMLKLCWGFTSPFCMPAG